VVGCPGVGRFSLRCSESCACVALVLTWACTAVKLTGGVDGALGCLLDVLKELRLGGAGVAQQQHVDVAAQPVRAAWGLLLQQRKYTWLQTLRLTLDQLSLVERASLCIVSVVRSERHPDHFFLLNSC